MIFCVQIILLIPPTHADLFDQKGRVAVITGGNRGIGLHVVEKLLACHITVVMGVRNVESSRKTVFAAIPEETRRDLLYFETLDTGSLKSVREFAVAIKAKYPKVDLLINNGELVNGQLSTQLIFSSFQLELWPLL